MSKRRRDHRNDLGSIFAASVITVLGTGICCILYAVGMPAASPWILVLIITPAVFGLAALVGVRWPKMGTGLEFWNAVFRSRTQDDRAIDYQPRRVDPAPIGTPGQQQPTTADEVREIRLLSTNTWVPTRSRKKNDNDFPD